MIDRSVMQKSIAFLSWWMVGLACAVLAAAVLKLGLLAANAVPFNADEAIVALMARHILQGERPLFFYGQAYMGSLDAIFVAAVFKLFGTHVWGIRLVQMLLYTGTLLTAGWLGQSISGKWQIGMIAAWLLVIPTITMTLYTTVSMGGYGEMLLIGNCILLLTISIARQETVLDQRKLSLQWLGLGFLAGFGVWVFGLTLVYSLPAVGFLAWQSIRYKLRQDETPDINLEGEADLLRNKIGMRGSRNRVTHWGVLLVGLLIGLLPMLAFAIQGDTSSLLGELAGGAVAGVESAGIAAQVVRHGLYLSLFGTTVIIGLRPSWGISWLGLPLAPLVLSFWVAVIIFAIRKTIRDWKSGLFAAGYSFSPLLSAIVVILLVGFVISPFGADPSGRYFLPVSVVLVLFAAQAIWDWQKRWGKGVFAAIGLVIIFNLWGTIQAASKTQPGVTTQIDAVTQIDHRYDQELIAFLRKQGEQFGYTNYWVAYPLAFLSSEELIFVPALPYHPDLRYTSRDNRYAPYQVQVDQADRAAYITTKNPLLDEKLRAGFANLGIDWKEQIIGDYQVYYGLSIKVTPEQVGLGGDEG